MSHTSVAQVSARLLVLDGAPVVVGIIVALACECGMEARTAENAAVFSVTLADWPPSQGQHGRDGVGRRIYRNPEGSGQASLPLGPSDTTDVDARGRLADLVRRPGVDPAWFIV